MPITYFITVEDDDPADKKLHDALIQARGKKKRHGMQYVLNHLSTEMGEMKMGVIDPERDLTIEGRKKI